MNRHTLGMRILGNKQLRNSVVRWFGHLDVIISSAKEKPVILRVSYVLNNVTLLIAGMFPSTSKELQ